MKNYRITVNGNVYDVSVEELNGNVATAPVMQTSTPVATPKKISDGKILDSSRRKK